MKKQICFLRVILHDPHSERQTTQTWGLEDGKHDPETSYTDDVLGVLESGLRCLGVCTETTDHLGFLASSKRPNLP